MKKLEILKEFKEFAVRGNVIDMAVGIIIGAAFGKIVNSLVQDVVMPPVGVLIGGIDFSDHFIRLSGKSYATLTEARAARGCDLKLWHLFKYNSLISYCRFVCLFSC